MSFKSTSACKVHGFGYPIVKDFFMSLGRLLESAEGQRNTAPFDSAEFFSCCL